MKRRLVTLAAVAAVTGAGAFAAIPAQASNVSWGVSIGVPGFGIYAGAPAWGVCAEAVAAASTKAAAAPAVQ